MTACDAGPLFALIDPTQVGPNARCCAALPSLSAPLLTTWPCFTEAMYLAHRRGGWPMQRLLWRYVEDGVLMLHEPTGDEVKRIATLMDQYRDLPMDLADASLVAAAEARGLSRVFTLDSHFHAYRMNGGKAFEVVPT